jgi:hypothetical protein
VGFYKYYDLSLVLLNFGHLFLLGVGELGLELILQGQLLQNRDGLV